MIRIHFTASKAATGFALICLTSPAWGIETPKKAEPIETKEAPPEEKKSSEENTEPDYWESQAARWFVGTKIGLGAVNNALLSLGYGKPNWMWAGVRGKALLTTDFVSVSAGPQIELLIANAYFRVRRTSAFKRRLPELAEVYTEDDFKDKAQPRSQYTSLDAGLWGFVPAGPTLGLWSVSGYYFPTKPEGLGLFSEYLRSTLDEDMALLPQLIWWWVFMDGDFLLGAAGDAVITGNRPSLFRLGPSAVVNFGDHLRFEAILTLPVSSPDDLNLMTESWGTARFTWSWASGEPSPGFW